jgi:hypothetical protein
MVWIGGYFFLCFFFFFSPPSISSSTSIVACRSFVCFLSLLTLAGEPLHCWSIIFNNQIYSLNSHYTNHTATTNSFIMGNNLSNPVLPDLSGVVLSPSDANADLILAGFWIGVPYVCAMIFSTCTLIDRWRGPHDKIRTGPSNVLAALILSAAWPVVMAYILVSSG